MLSASLNKNISFLSLHASLVVSNMNDCGGECDDLDGDDKDDVEDILYTKYPTIIYVDFKIYEKWANLQSFFFYFFFLNTVLKSIVNTYC